MALAASLLIGAIVSGWFAVHAGRQRNIAYTAQELAKQDRIVAELEREAAKVERNRAEAARTRAEGSEQTAIVERDKANTFNTELTKSKENQRRMLYGAQMNLVQKAWEMDDAIQVQKLLNATRQRPAKPTCGESSGTTGSSSCTRKIEFSNCHCGCFIEGFVTYLPASDQDHLPKMSPKEQRSATTAGGWRRLRAPTILTIRIRS